MPPISRREQADLDELLSDIYRGIETLPDQRSEGGGSYIITRSNVARDKSPIIGRAYVREFEVPASSPLVQRQKQAVLAAQDPYNLQAQPQRSTLKRQTGGGSQTPDFRNNASYTSPQASQSLATFLSANPATGLPISTTPDNKRRVRIVDNPEKSSKKQAPGTRAENNDSNYNNSNYNNNDDDDEDEDDEENEYPSNDYYNEPQANQFDSVYVSTSPKKPAPKERVKYVNTNKLIYHQEEEALEGTESHKKPVEDSENDDDIDGVTRVEYYHTTWLDRQLGRASKRRSSKELNERQVKEKAMIEELKRNLKSGAITLRQSLRGKKNHSSKNKASDIFDDQLLDRNNNNNSYDPYNSREQPQVVKTGIATLPRNHHKKSLNNNSNTNTNTNNQFGNRKHEPNQQRTNFWSQTLAPKSTTRGNYYESQRIDKQEQDYLPSGKDKTSAQNNPHPNSSTFSHRPPEQTSVSKSSSNLARNQQSINQAAQVAQAKSPMQTSNNNYQDNISQTYSSRTLPHRKPEQPHQLLQSHYRGNLNLNKSNTLQRIDSPKAAPTPTSYTNFNQPQSQTIDKMRHPTQSSYNRNVNDCVSPNLYGGNKSPLQQSTANTISGIPSATEVVRSALSRSNSQVSLNQLNKTINLLPNSPPVASPMTPTQQLRAASPSLSPSPARSPISHPYASKTLGHQHQHQPNQTHYLPGQTVLHGSRTIGRPPQSQPQAQQHQQQQQQQPANVCNQPQVYANPHASLMQHRMEQQAKQPNRNVASIREFNELDSLLRSLGPSVPGSTSTHITPGFSNKPAQASLGGYMPANYQPQVAPQQYNKPNTTDMYARVQKPPAQRPQPQPTGPGISTTNQPFTIDVSNKKLDENCVQRRRQEVSEFETPIELLPSMEDYQNIAKLNPVKNHYWYKPNMTRELAIHLLKDKPQGTFIVRDSTSFKGAYGLAVKVAKLPKNVLANLRNYDGDQSAEYIRHFLIEPTGSGVRLKGYANEPVFDSLPDLIYQHSLTELALPCKLIIPRADIEDPRFNQKQKQFFDDFLASKEQAKHQPYERTSPDGGYRRYPGDVLVHNEHRIIFQ